MLLAGTTYYIQLIEGSNGIGSAYNLQFAFTAEAGGLPCEAIDVPFSSFQSSALTLSGSTTKGISMYQPCRSVYQLGQYYKFTVTSQGTVGVDTCTGTTFDSYISVYRADNCQQINKQNGCFMSNDDLCSTQSKVFIGAEVGVTYFVFVGLDSGTGGAYSVKFTFTASTSGYSPCTAIDANFSAFTSTGILLTDNLLTGSRSVTDCYPGAAKLSKFYKFTATSSGTVTVDTCTGTTWDSQLAYFQVTDCKTIPSQNSCSLTNDNSCSSQSKLTITVLSGLTYYIQLTANAAVTDYPYQMRFTYVTSTVSPSACTANSVSMSNFISSPFVVSGTLVGSSSYTGICFSGRPSVFYSFTATADGTVQVDTCSGTSFNTILGIYQVEACNQISLAKNCLATNDDFCGTQSKIFFSVYSGSSYFVQLSQSPSGSGSTFQLTFTYFAPIGATPCTATSVPFSSFQSAPFSVTGNILNGMKFQATCPNTEPINSQFYTFTPTADGTVLVDTCSGTLLSTDVSIYEEASCSAVGGSSTCLALDTNTCGSQSISGVPVYKGNTYYVQVTVASGGSVSSPTYSLQFTFYPAIGALPCNAISVPFSTMVSNGLYTVSGDIRSGWPAYLSCYARKVQSQFYTFTATQDGSVIIDGCDQSNWYTSLGVYKNPTCNGIEFAADCIINDQDGCSGYGSYLGFPVLNGETYIIQLGDYYSDNYGSTYSLKFNFYPVIGATPCTAISVPFSNFASTAFTVTGDIRNGMKYNLQCYQYLVQSQFYTFTATQTGTVFIDGCQGTNWYQTFAVFKDQPCNSLLSTEDCIDIEVSSCSSFGSTLAFPVSPGETYYIQIADYYTDHYGNTYSLTFSFYPVIAGTPCTAISVPFSSFISTSYAVSGDIRNGMRYNYQCYNYLVQSQFYTFTATQQGTVYIDSCTSGPTWYQTFAVFKNQPCLAIQSTEDCIEVQSSACSGFGSYAWFPVSESETYYLQVADYYTDHYGDVYTINFSFYPVIAATPCTATTIDYAALVTTPITLTNSLYNGRPFNFQCYDYLVQSQFYKLTATVEGNVEFTTCGTSYPTAMSLFKNPSCDSVYYTTGLCLIETTGSCPRIIFPTYAGETFYIQISDYYTDTYNGQYSLSLTFYPYEYSKACTARVVDFTTFISAPITINGNLKKGEATYSSCTGEWQYSQFYKIHCNS